MRRLEVSPTAKVLEIGLGAGDVTIMLTEHFQKIVCVDSDPRNIELVRGRLDPPRRERTNFIACPIEQLELPDGRYDHIMLICLLEHLVDPVSVLARLTDRLAEGGLVHIVVNLAGSLHRRLGVEMGLIKKLTELSDSDTRLGHYRVYTAELLAEQITSSGLCVCREERFYLKPLPTKMLSQLPLELHRGLCSLAQQLPDLASYIYVEASRQ